MGVCGTIFTTDNGNEGGGRRFEGGEVGPVIEGAWVLFRIVFSSFAPFMPGRRDTEGAARGDLICEVLRGDPTMH